MPINQAETKDETFPQIQRCTQSGNHPGVVRQGALAPAPRSPAVSWGHRARPAFPVDDESLQAYLEEAASTLRALPHAALKAHLTSWPEVVQDTASLLVASERARPRPAPPHPLAIDRMDEVLSWLTSCEEVERRILWARACRIPWRKLEAMDGRSHTTLRLVASRGLQRVRHHILEARGSFETTNLERRLARGFSNLRASDKK